MWFCVYTGLTLSARIYKLYLCSPTKLTKTSYAHYIFRVSFTWKRSNYDFFVKMLFQLVIHMSVQMSCYTLANE